MSFAVHCDASNAHTKMSCHSCNHYFQKYYDVTHVIEFTHLSFGLIDLTNDRLIRWTLRPQEYDITIKHKKGHLMQGPDALSRIYEANVVDCASFDSCKEKIYNELLEPAIAKPINKQYVFEHDTLVASFE